MRTLTTNKVDDTPFKLSRGWDWIYDKKAKFLLPTS